MIVSSYTWYFYKKSDIFWPLVDNRSKLLVIWKFLNVGKLVRVSRFHHTELLISEGLIEFFRDVWAPCFDRKSRGIKWVTRLPFPSTLSEAQGSKVVAFGHWQTGFTLDKVGICTTCGRLQEDSTQPDQNDNNKDVVTAKKGQRRKKSYIKVPKQLTGPTDNLRENSGLLGDD